MTLIAVTCSHSHKDQRSSLSDAYVHALEQAGATPVILPPSLSPSKSARVLERMDGVLFSGGPDMSPLIGHQPQPNLGTIDPYRDEQEGAMFEAARKLSLPILGICRGMQVINILMGGTIVQHLETHREKAIQHQQNAPGWHRHHHVEIKGGTILANILGEGAIGVNSYHHQAVGEIAQGLQVSAVAPDGVVEGIECSTPWILGTQWHPEMMFKKYDEFLGIFETFVAACRGEKLCRK